MSANFNIPENTPITFDTVVQVMASYDMGWSTRGTGRDYDSLNGFGALVGYYSQGVLDYKTCNRKCKKCDMGNSPFNHDCRKNFSGSAKAMEAYAANKLVNESSVLKERNVQIGILIGDNDSSAIAACRLGASHPVAKLSDSNHTSKGVTSELHKIKANHKELKGEAIKYLHRCFTYAVAQNKGNSAIMAQNIRCIPYHAYNLHDQCDVKWCGFKQNPENYDHKVIPGGFEEPKLFEALKNIVEKLAANAEKFSVGVSSNINESLNASMASKAPKSKCLSLTASADQRYAAVVSQINIGYSYTQKTATKLNLSPGKLHSKYISRMQRIKGLKIALIHTKHFKSRRNELKTKKRALRYQMESSEGIMYQSHCNLLSEPAVQCLDDLSNDEEGTMNEKIPVIYFDLETTGFEADCGLLQIAAKCGEHEFSKYMKCNQDITEKASLAHGIRKIGGDLFLHGEKMQSVYSPRIAIDEFITWLKSFNKKCYLTAHNLNFDGPRLFEAIHSFSLGDDFAAVTEGFIDTLKIIQKVTQRNGTGECKIENLVTWLNLPKNDLHNAAQDVKILEKILKKLEVPYNEIIKFSITYADATDQWVLNKKIRQLLPSLNELENIVKKPIRRKLIIADITVPLLKEEYEKSGALGITKLLNKKENNKRIISLKSTTIQKIINWLQKSNK